MTEEQAPYNARRDQELLVGIVVPSGTTVHAHMAMSLARLVGHSLCCQIPVILYNPQSSLVQRGCYMGTMEALADDCTHILFLDSDMVVPENTLTRLLEHDQEVVGAVYPTRAKPLQVAAHQTEDRRWTSWELQEIAKGTKGGGLTLGYKMPAGCLLVRSTVFDQLDQPWWDVVWSEALQDYVGEDYTFCDKLRAARIPFFIDTRLSAEIQHIGAFPVNLSMLQ